MSELMKTTQSRELAVVDAVTSIATEQAALGELLRAVGSLLGSTRREGNTDAVVQPLTGLLQAAERLQQVLRAELTETGALLRAPADGKAETGTEEDGEE